MVGDSLRPPSDMNINPKRSSVSDVRKALLEATGEAKWTVNDDWNYFLTKRFIVFNTIATTNPKNWEDPDVGRRIDNAFKEAAGEVIPSWAKPMIEYDKAVEWMRRQHWKNNKNKAPLAGESVSLPQVAGDASTGVTSSSGGATGAQDGAGASSYWEDVLQK